MEAHQKLTAPKSHYPIRFLTWKVSSNESVERDQSLGIYEYTETINTTNEETGVETIQQVRRKELLRTLYAGTFTKAIAKPGQEISDPSFELGIITEPCGHAVQLAGLCALCGKDLTLGDYLGSDVSRATINMTHDAKGVTVSLDEAKRIEEDTTKRLRREKKLSLILDLDQTVIHATGDPTVGEWMADANNPNYPALHDVHSFVLPDSPLVYYIKLRPGTREFLAEMNKLYEMHIYTMGTRQYALAVAKILDLSEDYFKSRILSRDESGSFSMKSIQRLFPCDQSMVAVVDDRGDVWNWSPNLFRVKPYDFFVGIGDINEPVYAASRNPQMKQAQITPPTTLSDTAEIPASSDATTDKEELLHIMHDIQVHSLEQQQETRPLLHTQEVADEKADAESTSSSSTVQASNAAPTKLRRPVLADNDYVLQHVLRTFQHVHKVFYDPSTPKEDQDVRVILPRMKSSVLKGVHLVFSSVIPIGQAAETHPYWILATSFGAVCHLDLNEHVTHVVAAKQGTAKVNAAKKSKHIWIVKPEWLVESVTNWKREKESFFLLEANGGNLEEELLNLDDDTNDETGIDDALDEEIFARFGEDDWKDMDKEVEEAMLLESEEEGSEEVGEEDETSLRMDRDVASSSQQSIASRRSRASKGDKSSSETEDWDDFAEELENELDTVSSEPSSSLKRRYEEEELKPSPKKKFKVVLETLDTLESIQTTTTQDNEAEGDYFEQLDSWTGDEN